MTSYIISGVRHWLQSEVVNHEQVGPGVEREPLVVGVVGAASVEMTQQLVGVSEDDIKAAATSFVGQRLSQMAFPNTGRPAVKPVGGFKNPRF